MATLNLLRRLMARHGLFLGVSALLFGVFEFLMCAFVSSVNLSGALEELLKTVPPFVRSLVGEQLLGGISNRGILAFAWNHPFIQALGTAAAIILAARAVAGEIESGAAEILLSQPLSRTTYLRGHVLFAVAALLGLSVAGVIGTIVGQVRFDLELFEAFSVVELGLNFFLLQTAWYGLALALSTAGRESGRVATTAFLLALVSYIMQGLGMLWPRAAFLLPYSLHHYYAPQTVLIQGQLPATSLAVLAVVSAASLAFAFWYFRRRDIP